MRQKMAHVLADVVARPVAMIDEVAFADRRDDPGSHVFPLRRELRLPSLFDEVLRAQNGSDGDEQRQHGFPAVGLALQAPCRS
ncbi:hypothetical protein [Bradyrhizobium sp. BR 1432]|uniref:hypothetical protein n=1 Tax=Bradyrhizobium sp. BR 1432 TaxID=3447966 RepID=UPI003EE73CBB